MDTSNDSWQGAEFLTAVHTVAREINDAIFIKATVDIASVLAVDPRTLRQLEILWVLTRPEMTHEARARYVAILDPTGSGKTRYIWYAARLRDMLFPAPDGAKAKTLVVGPLKSLGETTADKINTLKGCLRAVTLTQDTTAKELSKVLKDPAITHIFVPPEALQSHQANRDVTTAFFFQTVVISWLLTNST